MLQFDRAKLRTFFWFVSLQVRRSLSAPRFPSSCSRGIITSSSTSIYSGTCNLLGVLYALPNSYDTGVEGISVSYPPFALLFYLPYLLLYYVFGPMDRVQMPSLVLFLLRRFMS